MTFECAAVCRQLLELQQQIIDTPRFTAALQVCQDRDSDATRAAEPTLHAASPNLRIAAILNADHHVRAMAANAGELRQHVVPLDGLGDELESLSELMLRAARMIVLTELDSLSSVLGNATGELRARTLCWGAFDTVDDLTRRVRVRLAQITNSWMAARKFAAADRAAYRTVLRSAHNGMRHLGGASAFGTFLREACTRREWSALQQPCTRMRDALVLRIEVDADVPLIVHSGPFGERPAEQAS